MAHDTEVKAVLRAYQKAFDALQRLDRAGATSELARALGVSRQRVDEVLGRARHERATGVEDVTD